MKKYSFSILVILLCAVFIFSGCTKAKTATPQMINELYQTTARKYGKYNGSEKYKIFDADLKVDLYSSNAYSNKVYNQITHLQDDASYSLVNMLREGGEYQPLMEAMSSFYNNRNFIATYVEIPQELLTKMYNATDGLENVLSPLLSTKEAFETIIQNLDEPSSLAISGSFKNYLGNYRKLMQSMFEINKVYEEIYTTCIYIPRENTLRLTDGELQRVVLSSSLYIAQYYYYKQFVLNTDYFNRFSYQTIYNTETGEAENNPNYDSGYANFVKMVNNINNISDPVNMNDPDRLTYYNASISKLQSLKVNVENYKIAVQKVADYKNKNKTEIIPANSNLTKYVDFINDMETQIVSYVNYLLLNIMDMA